MPTTTERLDWNALPESVREFLAAVAGGAIIERDGQLVGRYVPVVPPSSDDGDWTPAKNQRRAALIDRTITPVESAELETLTEQMRRFIDRVAPLSLEPLRRIHQQLVEKALAPQREKSEDCSIRVSSFTRSVRRSPFGFRGGVVNRCQSRRRIRPRLWFG